MKIAVSICLLALALTPRASAQVFNITDGPQHGFYGGVGIGPTTKDFSAGLGYAEKLPSTKATYSYSGASFVPALVTNANGSKSLSFTSVVHTGFSQAVYQNGRFLATADIGAGTSLPSTQAPSFNLAAIGAVNLGWRLNKVYNTQPGGTNNYIGIRPQFTQLTGDRGGTVISIGIGFFHGVN